MCETLLGHYDNEINPYGLSGSKSKIVHCPPTWTQRSPSIGVLIMKQHPQQSKLLLTLLTRSHSPGRRRNGGFSLAVTLLVLLAAVVGSMAMANLATSGNLGALFQGESSEAKEAAEAGLASVISELNKDENRRLLVTANTGWASTQAYQNPCLSQNPATATILPSATAVGFANPSTLNDLGGGRSFRVTSKRVISVDPTTGARTTPRGTPTGTTNDLADGQFPGFIEITVVGSFRNATASVTREFQVVPKCCSQSFGSMPTGLTTGTGTQVLGSDNRACDSSFPRILIGSNGGGLISTGLNSGRIGTLNANGTVNFNDKPNVVCLKNTSSNICGPTGSSQTVDSTAVSPISLQLPAVPAYPCPVGQTCTNGLTIVATSAANSLSSVNSGTACSTRNCSTTQTETTTVQSNTNRDYLRTAVNGSGNLEVQLCNTTNNNSSNVTANPSAPAAFADSCSPTYGATTTITRTRTTRCNNSLVCTQTAWSAPTTTTSGGVNINEYCVKTNDGAFSCRLTSLKVYDDTNASSGNTGSSVNTTNLNRRQNNTFYIDTSNAPINLFFNKEWNATSLNLNASVDNVGNGNADGQLQQVYCSSPSASTPCGTKAGANNNNRATVISNDNVSPITIGIGDDGYMRDFFVYSPFATFLLNNPVDSSATVGSVERNFDDGIFPYYQGSLWVNNVQFQANASNTGRTWLAVPGGSLNAYTLGTSNSLFSLPVYDWAARSSNTTSLY